MSSWRPSVFPGFPAASARCRSAGFWRAVRWLALRGGLVVGACLVFSLVMVAAAGWYTSRPQFCNSCHIMDPYYKSWQESNHKDVTCIECHFPPGIGGEVRGKMLGLVQVAKYVTASAGPRPTAEVPDASCLRSGCHETRLLTGRRRFPRHPLRPHARTSARPAAASSSAAPVATARSCKGKHMTVTPTTCFLCHFKGQPFNEGLGALHALPPDSRRGSSTSAAA